VVATRPAIPGPPFDQAEADAILADLRRQLAEVERRQYGGKFPPVLATVVNDCLEVAAGYARDHELEAARGWDAMKLLRGAVPWALGVARGQGSMPAGKR
jgi:hypothetical protein